MSQQSENQTQAISSQKDDWRIPAAISLITIAFPLFLGVAGIYSQANMERGEPQPVQENTPVEIIEAETPQAKTLTLDMFS